MEAQIDIAIIAVAMYAIGYIFERIGIALTQYADRRDARLSAERN